MSASLVVETAQVWSTHHVATLIGYGASGAPVHAVPRRDAAHDAARRGQEGQGRGRERTSGIENARNALKAGVLKIMSKIGISTLSSYHGP